MANKNDSDPVRIDKLMAKQIDTTDGTVIYQGMAEIGSLTSQAKWQIKKTIINGANISVTWANGTKDYLNIWNNRTSITYS